MAGNRGTPSYNVVDSFCGAGGLSLGLEEAGLNVAGAFDIDEASLETYKTNLESTAWNEDARELDGEDVLSMIGVEDVHLLAGGPPCQGFSKQRRGAHRLEDDRNDLVFDFARIVSEIEPSFFLMEQVAQFGRKRGKSFVREISRSLSQYDLFPDFYLASDYGLAQDRERFVIVGKHEKLEAPFLKPDPLETTPTLEDAIGDLPSPPDDHSEHPNFPNHQASKVTERNIERFSHVPPGGGWQDIPEELRLDCHKNVDPSSGGWPDVYGRLEWDGRAPTLTKGFFSFTKGRYGHPEEDRAITPREAARIQGFPDDFVFKGNLGDIRSQIGNAVPPPLAEAIGVQIKKTLLCEDGELDESSLKADAQPSTAHVPLSRFT